MHTHFYNIMQSTTMTQQVVVCTAELLNYITMYIFVVTHCMSDLYNM